MKIEFSKINRTIDFRERVVRNFTSEGNLDIDTLRQFSDLRSLIFRLTNYIMSSDVSHLRIIHYVCEAHCAITIDIKEVHLEGELERDFDFTSIIISFRALERMKEWVEGRKEITRQ